MYIGSLWQLRGKQRPGDQGVGDSLLPPQFLVRRQTKPKQINSRLQGLEVLNWASRTLEASLGSRIVALCGFEAGPSLLWASVLVSVQWKC